MDFYIDQIAEHSVQISMIGVIVAIYLMVYLNTSQNSEVEANRVIRILSAVIETEMKSIKNETTYENPYDLFTKIYPSLKEMNNERINELLTIINDYNNNWIMEVD